MDEKTIDQGSSRLSNKFLWYAFASLFIGSNVLNNYINTQYHNTIKIEENNAANKRRLSHAVEKQDFKNTIILLEFKLDECNENK